MKELSFAQNTQMGIVRGILRILGKVIFIKVNNRQYLDVMMKQMREKGALIEEKADWLMIDFIRDNQIVKLGDELIDLESDKKEEIEQKIYNFYFKQYKSMGWFVE